MIWKTTNGLGQEVTWYSEDEYNRLKEKLEKIDWYLSVFCASCKYFDGINFGFDLKDDTICREVCPNLFQKVEKYIRNIIRGE